MTCEIQHSQAEAFQPCSALNSSQTMKSVSLRTFDPLDLWLHVCLSKKTRIAFLKAPLWGREDHTESSAPAPPEKRRYKIAAAQLYLCLRLCTTSTELINNILPINTRGFCQSRQSILGCLLCQWSAAAQGIQI